jgi:hypothetical protein
VRCQIRGKNEEKSGSGSGINSRQLALFDSENSLKKRQLENLALFLLPQPDLIIPIP